MVRRRYTPDDLGERVVLARFGNLFMLGDHTGEVRGAWVDPDVLWRGNRDLVGDLLEQVEASTRRAQQLADRWEYVDEDGDQMRVLSRREAREGSYAITVMKPLKLRVRSKEEWESEAICDTSETIPFRQAYVGTPDGKRVQRRLVCPVAFDPWNRCWYVTRDGWRAYELREHDGRRDWELIAPWHKTPEYLAYRRQVEESKKRQAG